MGKVSLDMPRPYPKQIEFFLSESKYTAYGGARGGGKSWAARVKAVLLALHYTGIQILLLRRTLPELRENHMIPLLRLLGGLARYREQSKEFLFPNGSRIVLGYCDSERDVLQYQGQAYDVIFLEEATQFSDFQFQTLTESNRSSGLCRDAFSPRMYFTCNPGGVGHNWVKRLFITKQYRRSERAEDYTFISAKVYDNAFLMEHSPDYVRTLENLPEMRRRAMLHGDWDVFDGQFFPEFRRDIHVCRPFEIPAHWRWYFTMDYGGDMAAFYWIAVDEEGRAFVAKEFCQGRDKEQAPLLASDAAAVIAAYSEGLSMSAYLAPHDMWNTDIKSGKCVADLFAAAGIVLTKTNRDRLAGWAALREYLKPRQEVDGRLGAKLTIFDTCTELLRSLPALQFDPKKPSDAAISPHDITHSPDALRGFCVYWVGAAQAPQARCGVYTKDLREDWMQADAQTRRMMEKLYGRPDW